MKTLDQAIGRNKEFYKDAEKIDKDQLIDEKIRLIGADIVEDWESRNGLPTSDFALLAFKREGDPAVYTTLVGGKAVVRQVRKLIKNEAFTEEIETTLTLEENSVGNKYYVLV